VQTADPQRKEQETAGPPNLDAFMTTPRTKTQLSLFYWCIGILLN